MKKWVRFEEFVQEIMVEEKIPGVAVALSENGQTIYERGFGTKDIGTNEPITPDTIFGTASITKSFTALAIIKLVEKGKLILDDPVNKHLPDFQVNDNILIHHLLSHTTGLPTIERKEELKDLNAHINYLNEIDWKPLGQPGDYFCYHNDSFILLGAIIEAVTGEDYKKHLKELIFLPHEMSRTTFELSELKQLGNYTTPYIIENKQPTECPWPLLGNYAVGGGIRSTVTDLLKYGQVYVDQTNQYTEKMTKPILRTHGNSSYGYAFQITPNYEGVTLIEHGGGQAGVSSNFGFISEKGIVAVVLTNIRQASADAIWLAAINTALGIPITRKKFIAPHYELNQFQLAPFLGTYETGDGSKVVISLWNGSLQAQIDDETFLLRASNRETLIMIPNEKPIRFFFNKKNDTWALLFGLRMFVKKL